MRAPIYDRYGGPERVRVATVADPVPGPNDIMIRVRAATVSAADYTALRGSPAMIRLVCGPIRPKQPILGTDFAGEVVAVGARVNRFRVGDHVAGATGASFGAHAELICVPASGAVMPLPAGLDWTTSAALVDCTALVFLRELARVQPGQTVAINGASGSVGGIAVQLAKHYGASVIGLASGKNLERVQRLGANEVFDYAAQTLPLPGATVDVVIDVAGTSSFQRCRSMLTTTGTYLTGVPSVRIMRDVVLTRIDGRQRAMIAFTGLRANADKQPDLAFQLNLGAAGQLQPNLSAVFPFAAVGEAYQHIARGDKAGTVVLQYD